MQIGKERGNLLKVFKVQDMSKIGIPEFFALNEKFETADKLIRDIY